MFLDETHCSITLAPHAHTHTQLIAIIEWRAAIFDCQIVYFVARFSYAKATHEMISMEMTATAKLLLIVYNRIIRWRQKKEI